MDRGIASTAASFTRRLWPSPPYGSCCRNALSPRRHADMLLLLMGDAIERRAEYIDSSTSCTVLAGKPSFDARTRGFAHISSATIDGLGFFRRDYFSPFEAEARDYFLAASARTNADGAAPSSWSKSRRDMRIAGRFAASHCACSSPRLISFLSYRRAMLFAADYA